MRFLTIFIIFAIFLFFVPIFGQRGGGSTSSSSGSKKKTTSKKKRPRKLLHYLYDPDVYLYASIIGLTIYFNASQRAERKNKIEDAFKSFEEQSKNDPSVFTQSQKQNMADYFMKGKYVMTITLKDSSAIFDCNLQVDWFKRESENKYKVTLGGSDYVGKSRLKGLLMFKNGKIALQFFKQYSDRKKAGQTGSFSSLLYKGQGVQNKFCGQWKFLGHENQGKYSGSWIMKRKR